jgi:hypothetical protein
MRRHSEFQKIKRKSRATVRKNAKDSKIIKRYFDQFAMIAKKHEIDFDDT